MTPQEPLVAFRAWYTWEHPATAALHAGAAAQPRGERWLYSVSVGVRWSCGTNEAACRYHASMGLRALHLPDERAPVGRCQCGIYSLGSLEAARRYLDECHTQTRSLLVLGAVRIWGKTLVASVADPPTGAAAPVLRYRSQYAEVLALAREADAGGEIADRMGIPAVPEPYLEPYAREFGQQLRPADSTSARS
jgi:hypothetical protein